MALIRTINHSESLTRPQEEVECTYSYGDHGDTRLLTLKTFGRSSRANPEVASQTIQFDLQGAARLKALIEEVFPALKQNTT